MERGDQVLNFDLDDDDYVTFINLLRYKLAHHPHRDNYIARYGDWLKDRPLLPEQRSPSRPARWIYINLTVKQQNTRAVATLALRDDNVYFIGFKNRADRWFEFGFQGKNAQFIPGSTFLGCNGSYGALIGSDNGLADLDLGKEAMTRAVLRLSAYQLADQPAGPASAATKRDLARLCFMICEAARMKPHFETVEGDDDWSVNSRFEQEHIDYARSWSKMSQALILYALHDLPRLTTLVEFDVVHLLLNTRVPELSEGLWQDWQEKHPIQQSPTPGAGGGGSSQRGTGRSGLQPRPTDSSSGGGSQQRQGKPAGKSVRSRPLAEVFDLFIFPFQRDTVGSIAVFDGKRGQFIYKRGQALGGPYRAISADGSFAIQVYDILSGIDASGESSNVIGEMLWDCYDKNVEYDKVLKRDIISRDTGRQTLATVRYAVFSDAVEATVEVNLLLPAGSTTSVHGRISASYPELQFNKVVLFGRGRDEKLELAPSAAGSMVPLELARSVIVVPFSGRYSGVWIQVRLTAAHTNEERDVSLGEVMFFLDKHTGEIRVEQRRDRMVPGGWWRNPDATGGDGASGSGSGQGTGQTTVQQCKVQLNITSPGFHVSPLQPDYEHLDIILPPSWS